MTSTHEEHYPLDSILFLEEMWGDGFLSPGGPEEVDRLLSGVNLEGRTVVDIGSGAGGVPILLADRHGAARVIGLDVEATMVAHARAKIERAGLADRIEVRRVEPGPMPLPDASVDIVFSKDSIVHIPDKEALIPGNCGTRDFDEGTCSIHRIFGLRISEYLRRNSARKPVGIAGRLASRCCCCSSR